MLIILSAFSGIEQALQYFVLNINLKSNLL